MAFLRPEENWADAVILACFGDPGLAIARDPDASLARVQTALDAAAAQGAPTVILGGVGLVGMRVRLRYAGDLIDRVEAAARAASSAASGAATGAALISQNVGCAGG